MATWSRYPRTPAIENMALDMATDHNEQLEQQLRTVLAHANALADRLTELGHHNDRQVRNFYQWIANRK